MSLGLVEQFPGDLFYEEKLFGVLAQAAELDAGEGSPVWSCDLINMASARIDIRERLNDAEAGFDEENTSVLMSAGCLP